LTSKASKKTMKQINKSLILRNIYDCTGIDRASLAKLTSLSPATVTNLVGELIRDGLVKEKGVARSTGGRKPILLDVNPLRYLAVGMKIGVGYLDYTLFDLLGNAVTADRITVDGASPNEVVGRTIEVIEKWRGEHGDNILGIGVAVSGLVDTSRGVIRNSFLLGWKDVPMGEMLSQKCGTKTIVMNDADSFAFAQFLKGRAREYRSCVFITLGVGIGGALAVDGKLHTSSAGVGEFGHMAIARNGEICSCGSRGCLEAYISFDALANQVHQQTSSSELRKWFNQTKATETSEMEYLELALEKDPETVRVVFREMSINLGTAMKNLINIFAPEYLLVGGEALHFSKLFLNDAFDYARKNAFLGLADNVVFDVDELGEPAWSLGCAFRIIESELFSVKR